MKFLLLLLVIGIAAWMFNARRRGPPPVGKKAPTPPPAKPAAMLACVHCGVHVPSTETVSDAAGRPYCSEAHRLAGPR